MRCCGFPAFRTGLLNAPTHSHACHYRGFCYFSGMKKSLIFLALVAGGLVCGCGTDGGPKPAGPQGSDVSAMPWNTPQAGEGQGMLGHMLNR